jgi:hypothetical protein
VSTQGPKAAPHGEQEKGTQSEPNQHQPQAQAAKHGTTDSAGKRDELRGEHK